jgi:hypothetical protein
LSSLAQRSISGYLPLWLRQRAPGTLAALNGSFRRILRVDKSEHTVESYNVAVLLFADFLAERGYPLNVEALLGVTCSTRAPGRASIGPCGPQAPPPRQAPTLRRQ